MLIHSDFDQRVRNICLKVEMGGTALVEPSVVVARPGNDMVPAIHINSNVPFYPACMIKTPLAAACFAMCDRRELSLDDVLEVKPNDVTPTALETPYAAGTKDTVLNLIRYSLRMSDNIATNVLMDAIDRPTATDMLRSFGMKNTKLARKVWGSDAMDDPKATGRNAHTASDAARLFELIHLRQIPGAETMSDFLRFESRTSPGEIMIRKTGYTSNVNHMAGLWRLPDERWFVYALFTNMPLSTEGNQKICEFLDDLRLVIEDWH